MRAGTLPGTMVRGPHGVALALFVLVWLSCVWSGSFALNPNNATRLFAALALVERGEARIDRYHTLTIDKAQFAGADGMHYYMDKAPGMTLMALPALGAAQVATGTRLDDQVSDIANPRLIPFLALRLRLVVATTTAILTALAAVLLLDLGTGITGSPAAGLFAALGYALGSVVWGWSTTLFGHAPVAALLLIATWAVWRGTSSDRDLERWRYPVLAGAALGWAAVIEFPAALGGIAIGLWAIRRTQGLAWPVRRRLYLFALGATAVAGLPLVGYDLLAFGTPFKLGYQGVVGFGGMRQGLFGLTWPKPWVLLQILFGTRRGLVWVAPVLVLGVIGLWRMIRARKTRDLGLLAVTVIAIVLSVNAAYAYWDGGASMGPRHSVPAIPFLALGLAPFWASLRHAYSRIAAASVLAVSMLLNLVVAATDIFAPETMPFPLWTHDLAGLFPMGKLSTIPSNFWGWSPWFGFALYLDLALPLLALLLWMTRRAERKLRRPTS